MSIAFFPKTILEALVTHKESLKFAILMRFRLVPVP